MEGGWGTYRDYLGLDGFLEWYWSIICEKKCWDPWFLCEHHLQPVVCQGVHIRFSLKYRKNRLFGQTSIKWSAARVVQSTLFRFFHLDSSFWHDIGHFQSYCIKIFKNEGSFSEKTNHIWWKWVILAIFWYLLVFVML